MLCNAHFRLKAVLLRLLTRRLCKCIFERQSLAMTCLGCREKPWNRQLLPMHWTRWGIHLNSLIEHDRSSNASHFSTTVLCFGMKTSIAFLKSSLYVIQARLRASALKNVLTSQRHNTCPLCAIYDPLFVFRAPPLHIPKSIHIQTNRNDGPSAMQRHSIGRNDAAEHRTQILLQRRVQGARVAG